MDFYLGNVGKNGLWVKSADLTQLRQTRFVFIAVERRKVQHRVTSVRAVASEKAGTFKCAIWTFQFFQIANDCFCNFSFIFAISHLFLLITKHETRFRWNFQFLFLKMSQSSSQCFHFYILQSFTPVFILLSVLSQLYFQFVLAIFLRIFRRFSQRKVSNQDVSHPCDKYWCFSPGRQWMFW